MNLELIEYVLEYFNSIHVILGLAEFLIICAAGYLTSLKYQIDEKSGITFYEMPVIFLWVGIILLIISHYLISYVNGVLS